MPSVVLREKLWSRSKHSELGVDDKAGAVGAMEAHMDTGGIAGRAATGTRMACWKAMAGMGPMDIGT